MLCKFFCEGGDGFDGFDNWFAFLLFQNEVRTCGPNLGEISPDKFFGDDPGLRLARLDFGDFTNRWLGSSNSSGRSGKSTMPPVLGIASGGNFFLDNIEVRRLMECLRTVYEQIVSSAYLTIGKRLGQKLGAGICSACDRSCHVQVTHTLECVPLQHDDDNV